jgi:hypothetical protein
VRPVRRLGRVVAGEQRAAVDVTLQVVDLPERDGFAADVDRREPSIESLRGHECYGRRPVSTRRGGNQMEEMVRQTDQIINFTREINRRMTESGVAGVEGLVGLYDQLRTALAKVSPQEIEWAQSEVNRVLDSLKRLSEELGHLAALKAALESGH